MTKKNNYIEFLKMAGKSKKLRRTGWVREGIRNPESIAEHSFRVGLLALILSEKLGLDKDKMVKMALIHDLGEISTGDTVWTRGNIVDISIREQKEKEEQKVLSKLFDMVGNEELKAVFQEMLMGITKESMIFWQIDKLEMALQALEYEEEQDKNLEEFFLNADLFVKEPLLRKLLNEIVKRRKKEKGVYREYESL